MLVHFRLTVPTDLAGRTEELLVGNECVTNVVVQPGVCVDPPGDLVECDVARELADDLLHELTELGMAERGGIIWHPDIWSFLVALVAGTAGVLALSTEKTATMVGVLISVTTVPAAGNLALGLAVWEPGEILGSLAQLGANIGGMVLAGSLFLALQRGTWTWFGRHAERWFGQGAAR